MPGLAREFGAYRSGSGHTVAVFVPNVDRDNVPIKQQRWTDDASRLLAQLFGGSTVITGPGMWRDDERGGVILEQETQVVVSYVHNRDWTALARKELRRFLHSFGRKARQGEVGFVIDSAYFGVRQYDKEE